MPERTGERAVEKLSQQGHIRPGKRGEWQLIT
jgi:hypothetical protein